MNEEQPQGYLQVIEEALQERLRPYIGQPNTVDVRAQTAEAMTEVTGVEIDQSMMNVVNNVVTANVTIPAPMNWMQTNEVTYINANGDRFVQWSEPGQYDGFGVTTGMVTTATNGLRVYSGVLDIRSPEQRKIEELEDMLSRATEELMVAKKAQEKASKLEHEAEHRKLPI